MSKISYLLLLSFFGPNAWAEVPGEVEGASYAETFESFAPGEVPDLFILDGRFTVEEEQEGNHLLRIAPQPLVEGSVQVGPSLRSSAEIRARIKAAQKRRSYPRFGVGLHGVSGFKLRVVPSHRTVQLVQGEEVIQTVPFPWTSDQWYVLRLRVEMLSDSRWSISGWIWPEASDPPVQALIHYIGDEKRLQGKGSLLGTPYSGLPIDFDDVEIRELPGAPD